MATDVTTDYSPTPSLDKLESLVHTMNWVVVALVVLLCLAWVGKAAWRAYADTHAKRGEPPPPPTSAAIRASIDRDHKTLGLSPIQWPDDPAAKAAERQ